MGFYDKQMGKIRELLRKDGPLPYKTIKEIVQDKFGYKTVIPDNRLNIKAKKDNEITTEMRQGKTAAGHGSKICFYDIPGTEMGE